MGANMYKFQNNTTKENFIRNIEWSGMEIKPTEVHGKLQKSWQLSDKFGNVWNILFRGNVNEYSIFNVCKYQSDKPFRVDILSYGNNIEICKAEKNGRKIKANRLLKQFSQLAMTVNCYSQFGYLK